MTDRLQVVAQARDWMGTPFQHQARMHGVGVDCAGLVIGIARQLGLVDPDFDVSNYPRSPDGVTLLMWCDRYMTRVDRGQMMPGHVVVVAFDRDPQHLGILGDYRHGGLSIIHAAQKPGRVIETRLMFSPAMKFVAVYRLPGVE